MSCLHITGTRRTGDSAPFRFLGKKDRAAEVEANARHANAHIRAAAAASPHADWNTLYNLSHDPALSVREWVARNPKTDFIILWGLAQDPEFTVRGFVAWNPNATSNLLNMLIQDENETVRRLAATVLDNR